MKAVWLIVVAALIAACSSPPPRSRAEQLSFLREKGIVVDEKNIHDTGDGRMNFSLGVCNASYFFSGGMAYLYVYYTEENPIEQFQGDRIADAGKTASTMFCFQDKKEPRLGGSR